MEIEIRTELNIFEYIFAKGGPTFNIVAIDNPEYDPMKMTDKGNNEVSFVF
jgi:hypothetical protein